MKPTDSIEPLAQSSRTECRDLRLRLAEAEQTLDAIRSGLVDALIVRGLEGDQVFMLKGADEPYRLYVEAMREGAVTIDESGTILYCNRAFADMVGRALEGVIGSAFSDHVCPEFVCGVSPIRLGRIEIRLRGRDREVPAICSSIPFEIGHATAYALTITDLTQQKEHEAQLKKATTELEGFCYSVSHDMRAPLRSMIAAASIIIEDFGQDLPETARLELRRIATSASHLGHLMDDLLAYSRLARLEVSRRPVDLSEMATRISETLSKSTPSEVSWEIEPNLNVEGDPRLLEMALQNLLTNAAKFSRLSDQPRVLFGRDAASGAFYVKDNGIGFDMKYVEKLFVPFERLHRQQEYPGTGIGLANVKRVISRHGGEVWAEGEEGSGATFFFTVP
ncbi:MAG TPA: ATP-binding protein [Fimbriimonadaceae bacterium]|nr:ATP-binding protein [Fimbriimonadaceae bacterium]